MSGLHGRGWIACHWQPGKLASPRNWKCQSNRNQWDSAIWGQRHQVPWIVARWAQAQKLKVESDTQAMTAPIGTVAKEGWMDAVRMHQLTSPWTFVPGPHLLDSDPHVRGWPLPVGHAAAHINHAYWDPYRCIWKLYPWPMYPTVLSNWSWGYLKADIKKDSQLLLFYVPNFLKRG